MFEPEYRNRVIPAWALMVGTGLASAGAVAGTSSASSPGSPSVAAPAGADFQVATVAGTGNDMAAGGHVQHAYAQVLVVEPAFEPVVVSRLVEYCRDPAPGQGRGAVGVLSDLVGAAPGPDADAGNGNGDSNGGGADLHAAGFQAPMQEAVSCEQRREEAVEMLQVGYDVQYRYRGELFQSRLPEDPGDRLRIRVEITPAPAG